ncbi:hypothetical protein BB560_005058, partial [Smittium megazygosporum]
MRPSLLLLGKRSAWKGPYFVQFPNLRESILSKTDIFTKERSCTIMPYMVGAHFMVHNGKEYKPVVVTEEMIGHKL